MHGNNLKERWENAVVKFTNKWECWQREEKCERLGRIQYQIIEKKIINRNL